MLRVLRQQTVVLFLLLSTFIEWLQTEGRVCCALFILKK